jgi:ribonuclease Z
MHHTVPTSDNEDMVPMRLTLLGTGTPTPSIRRTSSSYLIETGGDLILFDTGPGSYFRYLQTGRSLTDLTHIVYSHFHYDHCADFAPIALARWDQGGGAIDDLNVIGPNHVHEFVTTMMGDNGAFAPDQDARTRHDASLGYYRARGGKGERARIAPVTHALKSGDTYDGNGWTLRCIEVPHVQPHLSCLAFRLDAEGQSFCYSGDASLSKPFMRLATDCDILVHMCHRISGTHLSEAAKTTSSGHMEVAEFAAGARVRTCILSHISEQMDVPGIPERLLREIGGTFGGNLVWGQDLMQLDFDIPQPGKLI